MAFARMNGADAEPQFTVSWSARHYRTLITHDDDHKYCIVEARSRQVGCFLTGRSDHMVVVAVWLSFKRLESTLVPFV